MNELPRSLNKLLLLLWLVCYTHAQFSAQALVRGKHYRKSLSRLELCNDSLMSALKQQKKIQATMDSLSEVNRGLISRLDQSDKFIQEYGCVDLSGTHWMVRSLRDSMYLDGTRMKEAKNIREWTEFYQTGEPCYVRIPKESNSEFGFLYNVHAVNSFYQWAPDFLEIPNSEHISALFNYLDMFFTDMELNERGALLKSADSWPITPGINSTGLSIMKGGFISGESFFMDVKTNFWILPDNKAEKVEALSFSDYNNQIGIFSRNRTDNYGFFIRCILKPKKYVK